MSTTAYLGLTNDYAVGDSLPHGQVNAIADDLEAITAGYVEKDCSGSADITPSAAEAACPEQILQGVLTGDIDYLLPAEPRRWLVHNDTSGAFAITVRTVSGAGVVVPQGYRAWVYGDGTDILPALTALPTGVEIGAAGTFVKQIKTGTVAINPASIAAGATGETAVTITGAAVGDFIQFNLPSTLEAGLVFAGAYVSAADTVKVRLANVTSGAIDGASLSWTYCWWDLT